MADALYRLDGRTATPAELTRGPWAPDAQHGGAPAALLAGVLERTGDPALPVVRLTLEFLRSVPIEPLSLSTRVVRGGRRVQLVEADLLAGEVAVVRATALKIRSAEGTTPLITDGSEPPPAPSAAPLRPVELAIARPWFGEDAVEVRFVTGDYGVPGPATSWFRLRVPVVAEEEPSPLQRAACAADFGNGVSSALDWSRFTFVNADLTVYLERAMAGEWVCVEAVTTVEPRGTGLTRSVLYDERGRIGQATQALYVAPR
jgi:Thioesterase-like superfamily